MSFSHARAAWSAAFSLCAAAAVAQDAPVTRLPPVVVDVYPYRETSAGQVDGWRALDARGSTRSLERLERVPLSIQVMPRQLIEEQGAVGQSEAVRNVSGVIPLPATNYGQAGLRVRGFPATRYIDGLPFQYDVGAREALAGVERIEVLKGPAAVLHQGGTQTIGGVVNVISALPEAKRKATFGFRTGSFDLVNPWFDINQPLSPEGELLFRISGELERSRSDIDVIDRRSYVLAPTVSWQNQSGTRLIVQGHLSRREQEDYSGLPAVGTLDTSRFAIRPDLFPGDPGIPRAKSDLAAATARFEHRFDDVWDTSHVVRYGRARFDEPAQSLLGNLPARGSTFNVFNVLLAEDVQELSAQSQLRARFRGFGGRHEALAAIDYNRSEDIGVVLASFAGAVDFTAPNFPRFERPAKSAFTTFTDADNVYTNAGATLQTTSVWGPLTILLGGRAALVDLDTKDLAAGTSRSTTKTRLLPRIGASYEAFDGVFLYGGYAEGLRGVPFFSGPDAQRPEETRQYDLGVKLNLGYGLSGTLALFRIERENVAVPDPARPGAQRQSGEQRSQGFEADLLWQPRPEASLLLSYAYTDAEVVKDTAVASGSTLAMVPKHSGRLWGVWRFLDGSPVAGLTLGAGVTAQSRAPIDAANTFFASGYATVDARIAYTIGAVTLEVSGRNLTDHQGFAPYFYFDGRVAPIQGRAIYTAATVTF